MKKIIVFMSILYTTSTFAGTQIIYLRAGWNLISINIKNCYFIGQKPPSVPVLPRTKYIKIDSLLDVFGRNSYLIEVMKSEDQEGEHLYVPRYPVNNNMTYISAGYGYWIKTQQSFNLRIHGHRAKPSDNLPLQEGWNLIGYWGLPTRDHKTPLWNTVALLKAFWSIQGKYSVIRSFDNNGPHTFDPDLPMVYNNMTYAAPGFGYQIKMKEPALIWYK